MSRVQHYGLCSTTTSHSPPHRPHCWPARGERGHDGSLPPYAGPLAGLWRGERDEAGRGPLKHTKNPVYVYAEFDSHVHSQANKVAHSQSQLDRTGRTIDMWVRWVHMCKAHKSKLYNFYETLSFIQQMIPLKNAKHFY